MISGTSLNGLIHREEFSHHGEVRVWVQAKNQHGSAKSREVVFNTENISKSDIITNNSIVFHTFLTIIIKKCFSGFQFKNLTLTCN